ncbi:MULTISPECIES: LysE family transporter [unclassified Acinetobacter]|uniref:LysE family transporter n=1 Tax=unclassified Acinetobacter TaxID=196816 RepID=UPI0029349222|nr:MULTISPECIES: LysE family transporter [unclassified Acinetobacter]WOE33260.1 LysE family transporter [Acinetobacter sp. SAAs470]WOE36959.1 LysE family transporter [Acinetobacter sp. SAAs474]
MLLAFGSLIFIHFCALITPGPDFFIVTQTAISRSRMQAIYVVLGITTAVLIWAFFALVGLNIIFEKFEWLRKAIMISGGIYLCWLGFQMLKSAFSKQNNLQESSDVTLPKSNLRFFIKGFLTNISNPKAVIYFGSVFSIFLSNPILNQMHFAMWLVIGIETFLWFSLVVFVFSFPKFKTMYQDTAKWIDGISGGIFTTFGIYLISQK